ncbi:MSCRAMM family adhesin SdrC, partial [Pseudomonadales bacterium]|nr:MSCRAMM family adhesin SdrC [Pseudomonadales bacterium]
QAANVTPLTTVLSSVDTPEAKAQVLAALGISGTPEELLTTDGWAAAEAGDEDAKAAQRVNQQVGLLLQTATTLTDDGDADTDVSVALAQSVAKQVSTMAQSEGNVDLTAPASIQSVLTQAAAEATPNVVIETSTIAAVATTVANVNTVVADPTLDPVSDTAQEIAGSAQENLQTSVAQLVSGEVDASEFLEDTSSTELFVNVVVAVDAPDNDNDGIPDSLDSDDDNDGVRDSADAFPKDSTETIDTDADGSGNNADTDDDGDGVADTADAFPLDKAETLDTDSDGTGNNADTDDDGDGVLDRSDAFPLDSTETFDTDLDGIGNNADTDDDGDGVIDTADSFPLIFNSAPLLLLNSTSIGVNENDLFVTQLVVSDAESDIVIFLLEGLDAEFFELSSIGQLSFKSAPDFESPKIAYQITIVISDGESLVEHDLDIFVLNVAENAFSDCKFGSCKFGE